MHNQSAQAQHMCESAPGTQVRLLQVSLSWKKEMSQHDSLPAADSAAAIIPMLKGFSDCALPAAAALAKFFVAAAADDAWKRCYNSDGVPA